MSIEPIRVSTAKIDIQLVLAAKTILHWETIREDSTPESQLEAIRSALHFLDARSTSTEIKDRRP